MPVNAADREEFTAFVLVRSGRLLRTAFLLTGDERAAEDLLQSALLSTLRHWSRIRDRESLEGFVRRVMVNERRSWFRRRASGELPVADIADHAVDDEIGRVGEVDAVRRALMSLPYRQRATVVLRYFEDLSESETARLLGCSTGTVKSQTSKALDKLRSVLREPAREESQT